ncbi:M23 family metallopeptidase, partial [Cryobacterium sp. MDB1-18-2]|uniref:M23 family metallopeptidase n=1 Tax=unclassified Cryobacterium TaxID=2649013 RepID=UPI00106B7879
MTAIYNKFTNPVISDDNRDADISWQHHIQRGSLGGVDLAYAYGTPVTASADGVVTNVPWYGTGGNTARLRLADGRYIEYMHLSQFTLASGTSVSVGTQIGLSGASGNGDPNFYAPHLHVHLYSGGIRQNVFHYFSVAGTDPTVFVGSLYEASSSNGWVNQPTSIGGVSSVAAIAVGGEKFLYTVSNGKVYEAASNNGWTSLSTG